MAAAKKEKVGSVKSLDSGSGSNGADVQTGELLGTEGLQRRLGNRQLHLIAIGGSIGTALFISIGNGLASGGPASLLIAFTMYCLIMACVNNCMAEMQVLHPVSGGFIRLAGKWVDESLGFMVGWNFFFYEALMIPFEITAINLLLSYWRDDIPVAAICVACIVLYAIINIFAVGTFGETEFWLSSGKVILLFILFFFTFITMVGGNPKHDAYGFRNWSAGAFAEYRSTGDKGRFEGFLACLWNAAFAIVGPEYISMSAAETIRPRILLKAAFKTIYWRFGLFFILSSICVGIVVPWNNPTIQDILAGKSNQKGGAASPYIVAMALLDIKVLPHVVNALLVTSVFSAGSTLTFCATRSLYGLAIDGRAPSILRKTTKKGVPIYAFMVVMAFPFLSLLQVSNSSAKVITWLVAIMTAGALIDYFVMCVTYIRFYNACKVQGFDRNTLPYKGFFQPYCAYIGATAMVIICLFYGYTAFSPFSVEAFFQNYTMQIMAPLLYLGWKLIKHTKIVKLEELDLVWERPSVDQYENSFEHPPPSFWSEMAGLVGIKYRQMGQPKDNKVEA